MKYSSVLFILLFTSCISQSAHQAVIDNSKRLEALIEKERKENDQLNAQRSVLESQLQSLNSQVSKLTSDKQSILENLNNQLIKQKEDAKKHEIEVKRLEGLVQQQKENNQKTVEALGEKINDLADDKRTLINENYKARKAAKKVTRKRRRR